MTKRASIDIGSNSVLLLIADISNGVREIVSESYVTSLGKDLDKRGEFSKEPMDETLKVLKLYADLCRENGIEPSHVIATATEAARVAKNANDFFSKVKDNTGIEVKIITGVAEAYFSTKGILLGATYTDDIIHILDIGGASTEIIKVEVTSQKIIESFSMPMGAVRLTNWLSEGILDNELSKIHKTFLNQLGKVQTEKLFCVAGTMTSISNINLGNKSFIESRVHGDKFSVEKVFEMEEKFKNYTLDEINAKYPFLGKRANFILGGILVAKTVFSWLGVKEVEISTYGLRYGTIGEKEVKDGFIFRDNK